MDLVYAVQLLGVRRNGGRRDYESSCSHGGVVGWAKIEGGAQRSWIRQSQVEREGRVKSERTILVAEQSTFAILPHLTKVRDFLPAAGESTSVARCQSSVGPALRLADSGRHALIRPDSADLAERRQQSARPTLLQ